MMGPEGILLISGLSISHFKVTSNSLFELNHWKGEFNMSLTCVSITFDDFLEFTSITHNSTPEFVVFVKAIFSSFGDH